MTILNSTVINGTKVRFYFKRADAIDTANRMTLATNQQHEEIRSRDGWLVRNVVTRARYDADGLLPDNLDLGLIPWRKRA